MKHQKKKSRVHLRSWVRYISMQMWIIFAAIWLQWAFGIVQIPIHRVHMRRNEKYSIRKV